MLIARTGDGRSVEIAAAGPDTVLPPDVVWLDLIQPDRAEELLVERSIGHEIPTEADMLEIEKATAGRLIDRWGTPWQIHPRAADSIDVRSAGPDRRLYTPDDVTNERPE